jgi:hypothetical protein
LGGGTNNEQAAIVLTTATITATATRLRNMVNAGNLQ